MFLENTNGNSFEKKVLIVFCFTFDVILIYFNFNLINFWFSRSNANELNISIKHKLLNTLIRVFCNSNYQYIFFSIRRLSFNTIHNRFHLKISCSPVIVQLMYTISLLILHVLSVRAQTGPYKNKTRKRCRSVYVPLGNDQ